MRNRKENSGFGLVALSAAAFGLLPLFAKTAYAAGTSSHTLLFLRFLAADVFMFSLIKIRKLPLPSKKEIVIFILLGAFVYVGQTLCYFTALKYASSGVVSLLLYTHPALVMLGSAILFHEKITLPKILSLCLAVAGAAIIIGAEFYADSLGIILAVLSSLFYAVYVLVNSRVVREGMGVQASAFIVLGTVVVYAFMNLFLGFTPPAEPGGYIAIALTALISTVLAFWAFLTGMERTGPSTASLISALEPVVTVISTAILLSERITGNVIIGGCLVLAALALISVLPGASSEAGGE